MKTTGGFRPLTLAVAVLAAGALAGCDGDDPVIPGDDHAEEVDAVRLTVGSQVVEVDIGGAVTGGPIAIPAGSSVAVTATFLDHDGDLIQLHADDYELRLEPQAAGVVTFTRSGAFAGTLTGVAAGQTSLAVLLWHLEEDHEDFEQLVTVSVQ